MKRYYKDGEIVERPKSLVFNGSTYVPPTDEILLQAGYNIIEVEPDPITNEMIAEQRAQEYAARADRYLLAYQAYMTLGETEKAEEMKNLWITIREEIDKEFPYLEERTENVIEPEEGTVVNGDYIENDDNTETEIDVSQGEEKVIYEIVQ